jgi:hypothetical protein
MKGPVSVRPTVTGASLRSAAARLPEPRVRDESTFPPRDLVARRQAEPGAKSALRSARGEIIAAGIDLGQIVPEQRKRPFRLVADEAVR